MSSYHQFENILTYLTIEEINNLSVNTILFNSYKSQLTQEKKFQYSIKSRVNIKLKMKSIFAAILLAVCVVESMQATIRATIPEDVDPLSQKMVEYINQLNTTWKVCNYFWFKSFNILKTFVFEL